MLRRKKSCYIVKTEKFIHKTLRVQFIHDDIPWKKISGMRDVLIHHYFGIDRDAVWRVVEHDLPLLKEQFLQAQD